MQRYFGALTIVLLIGTVMIRAMLMKKKGIEAMHFGKLDKTDLLIPPFALFYFYTIFAAAFNFPIVSKQEFFNSDVIAWGGVFLCLGGLLMLVWGIISFGESFRVGIDTDQPTKLHGQCQTLLSQTVLALNLFSISERCKNSTSHNTILSKCRVPGE